jgi:hypothetical protein
MVDRLLRFEELGDRLAPRMIREREHLRTIPITLSAELE